MLFSLSLDWPVNVNRIMLSPHAGAHAAAHIPRRWAVGGITCRHGARCTLLVSGQKHGTYRDRHAQRGPGRQPGPAEPPPAAPARPAGACPCTRKVEFLRLVQNVCSQEVRKCQTSKCVGNKRGNSNWKRFDRSPPWNASSASSAAPVAPRAWATAPDAGRGAVSGNMEIANEFSSQTRLHRPSVLRKQLFLL